MEPAMARVLALSLMAPKLTESLGKISFWTSAWTSSLQEAEDSSEMLKMPPRSINPSLLLMGKQESP